MGTQFESVLVTGANTGLGEEIARKFALRPGMKKVYLACRNEDKAKVAKADLERATGKSIFEILLIDISKPDSVRAAVDALPPIDAIVMSAGGLGGKNPNSKTSGGVTELYANNVLGHVALLEGLIAQGKLNKAAAFLSSEAVRGIPKMHIKRPALPSSSVDDFSAVINGQTFAGKKYDLMAAYGEVKYIGALWMSHVARKHPELKIVSVSPGSTSGTDVAINMPAAMRFMNNVLMPVLGPPMGLAHSLDKGSQRIIDVLTDDQYKSGRFYGSKADVLVGPLVDQSEIFHDLANSIYQDRASEAIHRYL